MVAVRSCEVPVRTVREWLADNNTNAKLLDEIVPLWPNIGSARQAKRVGYLGGTGPVGSQFGRKRKLVAKHDLDHLPTGQSPVQWTR